MNGAFALQRAAGDERGGLDYDQRLAALATLARLVKESEAAICEAIDADFSGRPAAETRLLEIFPSLESLRHARRHLRGWMKPRRVRSAWFMPGRSRIVAHPLGVVGIVVPWNYPLYLAIGPLVAAISAGNRALVKMSETAPRFGALFERLVAERFAPEVLRVVNGGPEVGRAFTALPFDHLLFTGSTEVGRHVMRAAAENLTPVTLELGGKSPAIVGRGIDVAEAAERILHGKCLNAGQTCIAPDYALVPEERVEAFVAAARACVARLYPGMPDNADYASIIDARHRERLGGYLEEARSRGVRVEVLGAAAPEGSTRMTPALLVDPPADLRLMREEIFGPLLPVVPYRGLDEAIAFVNGRPRPLALYVFDHDDDAVGRVLARTVFGGATVNETLLHIAQEELPFGGVGPSGMGEYHGRAGFDTFSKRKSVFHRSRFGASHLLRPPYGPRFAMLLRILLR